MARPRPVHWLKARPYVADSLLAVLVAAAQVTSHLLAADDSYPRSHPSAVGTVLSALIALPLVWRRPYPYRAIAAATVLLAIGEITLTNTNGWLTVLVCVYTLGAHRRGRTRTWAMLTFVGVNVVGCVLSWRQHTLQVGDIASGAIVLTIAFVIGDNLQRRRQAVADLAERAERAERERELLAREQVRDERTRIARELHDVVAHSLSVMVIQAGAARRQLARDPDRSATALAAIESTGRAAMDEMRRVLGVLRNGDDAPGELAPQPSLDDLPELLASSLDMPVQLRTEGTFDDLPAGVELSAYRVVQEAITNVRRHAGSVRSVDVSLRCDDEGLEVEVTDDGGRTWPVPASSGGFGLIGMRERVAALGGELAVGPRPGGGWAVRARFPATAR